jgi:3-deoxy-D-arabino-heptulosonate 7-phosphate (DAHP) synthase class II
MVSVQRPVIFVQEITGYFATLQGHSVELLQDIQSYLGSLTNGCDTDEVVALEAELRVSVIEDDHVRVAAILSCPARRCNVEGL